MTRYWRAADGLRLDTAPFVVALQHATGIAPVVLGKPARPFFAAALARLGAEASETLMIGDDIRGDIGGAQGAGIRGLLVRTGKFRPRDLRGEIQPDGVIDSIADLPAWWAESLLSC
jgi:ribonucleotide monophosphatase NagD (HAD superfamily)